jgi:hypothetical protein
MQVDSLCCFAIPLNTGENRRSPKKFQASVTDRMEIIPMMIGRSSWRRVMRTSTLPLEVAHADFPTLTALRVASTKRVEASASRTDV